MFNCLLLSNIDGEKTKVCLSLLQCICVFQDLISIFITHTFTTVNLLSSFELAFKSYHTVSAQGNCFLGDLLPSTFCQLSLEPLSSQFWFFCINSFIFFYPFSPIFFTLPFFYLLGNPTMFIFQLRNCQ